jgi:hypothetical protein
MWSFRAWRGDTRLLKGCKSRRGIDAALPFKCSSRFIVPAVFKTGAIVSQSRLRNISKYERLITPPLIQDQKLETKTSAPRLPLPYYCCLLPSLFLYCYPTTKTNMFVVARQITRRFRCAAVRHPSNLVNFGEYSSMSSFRHGVPEPRFTWMSPDASLRTGMLAVHAGMTDALP